MQYLVKFLKLALVVVVAQVALPVEWKPSNLLPKGPTKPLQTVTLAEAFDRVDASRGKPTVSVLYLTIIPSMLKEELSEDVKRWQKGGTAVHAFSIDAVGNKGDVPGFVRGMGPKVEPVWIQMPQGAACALKQLEAVNAFAGTRLNPREVIPLLTLVLKDAGGKVLKTHSVNVPNGGEVDPTDFEHALASFDVFVRRAMR